jgi:hypothetical protein
MGRGFPLSQQCVDAPGDPAPDPVGEKGLGQLRVGTGEHAVLVAEPHALEELLIGGLRRERPDNALDLLVVLAQ